MGMDAIGVSMPDELIERIDKARAREGMKDGDTPSRSEWLRRAAENELEREDVGGESASVTAEP